MTKKVLGTEEGIYKEVDGYLRRYPTTLAWRIRQHSKVIAKHLNNDEEVYYVFPAQRNPDSYNIFTTCLVSMIDIKKNTITVCNAGHYSPIIIKSDGNIKTDLNCKKGIPIGVIEDISYDNNVLSLDEINMICMYTDGVLEIKNKYKEEIEENPRSRSAKLRVAEKI